MKTQCNYFVANYQPACDSHSTWKERTALSVNNQLELDQSVKRKKVQHYVIYKKQHWQNPSKQKECSVANVEPNSDVLHTKLYLSYEIHCYRWNVLHVILWIIFYQYGKQIDYQPLLLERPQGAPQGRSIYWGPL